MDFVLFGLLFLFIVSLGFLLFRWYKVRQEPIEQLKPTDPVEPPEQVDDAQLQLDAALEFLEGKEIDKGLEILQQFNRPIKEIVSEQVHQVIAPKTVHFDVPAAVFSEDLPTVPKLEPVSASEAEVETEEEPEPELESEEEEDDGLLDWRENPQLSLYVNSEAQRIQDNPKDAFFIAQGIRDVWESTVPNYRLPDIFMA